MREQCRPRRAGPDRRPAALLSPDASIGVDVGGTKCLAVRVSAGGEVEAEHRMTTPKGAGPLVDAIVELAHELGPAPAVGVGVPGLVDRDGSLRFAPNLPGVVDLALRDQLRERLPTTAVSVDNDATCAAWGERELGAARGSDHAILVTLGTGIGGGIIIDGNVDRGAYGFAGEIGHMVVNPSGPQCVCGKRGCWERYASGSGLGWLAREAAVAGHATRLVELAGGDAEAVRGEHVTAACAEGDDGALAVMAEFGWWVALGLANLAAALDPERFVVGGGLIEAGEVLLAPTRAAFKTLVPGARYRPPVEIHAATLGERAGAIGAALLASAAPAP